MKFNPARKPCSFRVDAILRRKGVIGENMTFNEKEKKELLNRFNTKFLEENDVLGVTKKAK